MEFKKIFALAAVMTLGVSSVSFASGWQKGRIRKNDWKYLNENGSYASGWQAIDADGDGTGEYYYFDQAGWLKTGTTTPDGCTVNDQGQWTVDGAVRTVDMNTVSAKENEIGSMPAGEYKLSYIIYDYGKRTGTLDRNAESLVSVYSVNANAIILRCTTNYTNGAGTIFYKRFERQSSGEYVWTEGDSRLYLTWDADACNLTTDDEERCCVYDLVK